jgi:hypothetical protein
VPANDCSLLLCGCWAHTSVGQFTPSPGPDSSSAGGGGMQASQSFKKDGCSYTKCLEKSVVIMTGARCQLSGCSTVRVPNLRLTGRPLFRFFSRPGCAAGAAYACSVTEPQWGLQLPPQMLCRCKPVRPTPCVGHWLASAVAACWSL